VSRKSAEETLLRIEETQRALRRSIEETKHLADQSDQLIKRHRQELDGQRG
jgi:hypothetical protein